MLSGELGGEEGDFLAPSCKRRCGRGPWFAIGRLGAMGVTLQHGTTTMPRRPCLALQFEEVHTSLLLHLPISSDRKALTDSKYLIHMSIIPIGQQYPIGRMASWLTGLISSLKSHMHARQQIHSPNTSARHFSPPARPRLD